MKRKSDAVTLPLFSASRVPQMPEGYYSSGPNPNLRRFVEEHSTPYDPATDDYDVPPFDEPILSTKATAIYNMHTYWSKKPHDAVRQYIRHYTQPNDLVLDPFCGSGGTALAAMMDGRTPIAIDLSPAATFITKNYCAPVDIAEVQAAFEEVERGVRQEIDWLYETRCDRCDGRATTTYTVYSQVFQCPRCLEKFPLFDCVQLEGQTAQGKPKTINVCPYCHKQGQVEIIRSQSQKYGAVPVLVSYECEEGCRPRRGERRYNDPVAKKKAYFHEYDLGKLREIEAREIPHWYPRGYDMSGFNRYQRDALWLYGVREVADLFTKRNLWALATIRQAIMLVANEQIRDALLFCWNSVSLNVTRMTTNRDRLGFLKGTYYLPQICRCTNVWRTVTNKFAMMKPGWGELDNLVHTQLLISTQTATTLPSIKGGSVDYIFTDPPYADKEQYGELNFVWEAWLGFDTHWHQDEIIVNETRGKTDADWERMMREAMRECYRVLKPGRWISLCYHDTSEGTWQLVQDLMTEVGFVPEQMDKALFIDTGQKSYNQKIAEKVTKRDLVINFRKPLLGELNELILTADDDLGSFTEKARAILREILNAHPASPADRLYDELVSRMVRKGQFERHDFDALLRSVAEDPRGDGHWYLLDTADDVDEAESAKESAGAARLAGFMRSHLEQHPEAVGVHYSDLFEQYLLVQDKPRRLLQDWLPEFFFKTAEGTWRPPVNDEERAQKEALRTTGTLRRIKRFARALLEGVPPSDRDGPPNIATAADWIRQSRRAGLYEIGRALYEKGGFHFSELGEVGQLEVEEDYQICVRRS